MSDRSRRPRHEKITANNWCQNESRSKPKYEKILVVPVSSKEYHWLHLMLIIEGHVVCKVRKGFRGMRMPCSCAPRFSYAVCLLEGDRRTQRIDR